MPLLIAVLAPQVAAAEPLVRSDQIRMLSREDAAKALPVNLTGVVVQIGWQSLVLHDGQVSVFVDFRFAQEDGIWTGPPPNLGALEPGALVEIEGVTDPGGFSPMVLAAKLRRTGTRPVPVPLRPSLEKLLSSSLDSQWVEIEGVVTKFEDTPSQPQCLTLRVGGHPCPVIPRHRLEF